MNRRRCRKEPSILRLARRCRSLAWALFLLPIMLLPGTVLAAGGEFQQVAKLTASDADAGDEFGRRVDVEGDRAIVGAPHHSDLGADSGAAYIFERDAGGSDAWGEVVKLLAPEGGPDDFFGWDVAISGETALLGTPRSGENPGAAYVFERDLATGGWQAVATLTMDEPNDNFGGSVDLQEDTAIVGANFTDGPSGNNGAAFVYRRDAGGPGAWGQVAELAPAVGCGDFTTACGWWSDGLFGAPIALDGKLVIGAGGIGSGGFTYVFHRAQGEPERWRRIARTRPTDYSGGESFGSAVDLGGATLLVGAFTDNDLSRDSGSAYIFERDPGGPSPWTQVAKLLAPDGEAEDWFGRSAGLSGDLAVVGASQLTRGEPGYTWVFERDAGGADQWGPIAELLAADGEGSDHFGDSAAIDGVTVIVGAPCESSFGQCSGAAYIFERVPLAGRLRRARGELATASAQIEGGTPGDLQGRSSVAAAPVTGLPPYALAELDAAGSTMASARVGESCSALRSQDQLIQFRTEDHQTTLCLQFFSWGACDDLELTVSNGEISGWWRNSDCEGTDVPIAGSVEQGRGLIWCDDRPTAAFCPLDVTWAWIVDLPLDGTLDMFQFDEGMWNAWTDEITYTTSDGACPL